MINIGSYKNLALLLSKHSLPLIIMYRLSPLIKKMASSMNLTFTGVQFRKKGEYEQPINSYYTTEINIFLLFKEKTCVYWYFDNELEA
jgi:hypothetical protein